MSLLKTRFHGAMQYSKGGNRRIVLHNFDACAPKQWPARNYTPNSAKQWPSCLVVTDSSLPGLRAHMTGGNSHLEENSGDCVVPGGVANNPQILTPSPLPSSGIQGLSHTALFIVLRKASIGILTVPAPHPFPKLPSAPTTLPASCPPFIFTYSPLESNYCSSCAQGPGVIFWGPGTHQWSHS